MKCISLRIDEDQWVSPHNISKEGYYRKCLITKVDMVSNAATMDATAAEHLQIRMHVIKISNCVPKYLASMDAINKSSNPITTAEGVEISSFICFVMMQESSETKKKGDISIPSEWP
jgi:hypothetical protein